jgi:Amino acid synthesis
MKIRKIVTITDEVLVEMGTVITPPTRRAAAIAVIDNPFAGHSQADLSALVEIGADLGEMLTQQALAALRVPPDQVESYGKAAIVGEAGEIEHAAAILHPKLGAPMRGVLGGGTALVPSAKKRATMGAPIDVPLGHRNAAYVRSHFDAMELSVADAPRPGEILVAVVLTDSGRPLARVGGLAVADIQGQDGLR